MLEVLLRRVNTHPEEGTTGVLIVDGNPICITLEPTWRNNERNISCIPSGRYLCKRVDSPKYGDTFEVRNVPNRSHILFHTGNKDSHTKGCILLGERFTVVNNEYWITESRAAMMEFRQQIGASTESFYLNIEQHYSIF